MQKPAPPNNETTLLKRANAIAGQTLQDVAQTYNMKLPCNLRKTKGFVGQMLEQVLGANAKNQAKPDFQELNIELKTLPLNIKGHPRESTYVCSAPAKNIDTFENSWLKRKLNRVLWVPIEGEPTIPLTKRIIGTPFLWKLTEPFTNILKQDFEELVEMLNIGELGTLTAHYGQYLQIRPKAAHSRVLIHRLNSDCQPILMVPKGFYLRTCFTKQILQTKFHFKG